MCLNRISSLYDDNTGFVLHYQKETELVKWLYCIFSTVACCRKQRIQWARNCVCLFWNYGGLFVVEMVCRSFKVHMQNLGFSQSQCVHLNIICTTKCIVSTNTSKSICSYIHVYMGSCLLGTSELFLFLVHILFYVLFLYLSWLQMKTRRRWWHAQSSDSRL